MTDDPLYDLVKKVEDCQREFQAALRRTNDKDVLDALRKWQKAQRMVHEVLEERMEEDDAAR